MSKNRMGKRNLGWKAKQVIYNSALWMVLFLLVIMWLLIFFNPIILCVIYESPMYLWWYFLFPVELLIGIILTSALLKAIK